MSGVNSDYDLHAALFSQGTLMGRVALPTIVGGVGGVTSWNDLDDRPFYTQRGIGKILPETSPVYVEDMGAYLLLQEFTIKEGETYTVCYNGINMDVQAQAIVDDSSDVPITAVALGDSSMLGMGESTGEPFILLYVPPQFREDMGMPGICGLLMPLDGASDVTISISGMMDIVHTLPPEYLPPLRGQKTILIDLSEGTGSVAFDTALQMDPAELQSSTVVVYENSPCSVFGITQYPVIPAIVVHFMTPDGVFHRFVWDRSNGITQTSISYITGPDRMVRTNAVYGVVANGNGYQWRPTHQIAHEALLLKSTQSETYFKITVDDSGQLTATRDFDAPYDR